jgi:hypothetical protein
MNRSHYSLSGAVTLVILLLTLSLTLAQDTPPTLIITIPPGVNIRSLELSAFGQADSAFPRTDVEVVGWFDAADTPLAAFAGGIWLVLATEDGELRAVNADLVREADGTSVTDEEAETIKQYVYDGTEFVPVVTGSNAPNGDETAVALTPNPTLDSATDLTTRPTEFLAVPEVPDTIQFRYRDLLQIYNGEVGSDPETITVNRNHLLPIPLGLIGQGDFAATDSISVWQEGRPANEEWRRIPLSGIILSIDREPNTAVYYILMYTATENGIPFFGYIEMNGTMNRLRPYDDNLTLVGTQADADILHSPSSVFSTDRITATRNIVPGDQIVVTIYDVREPHHNPIGISYQVNAHINNIENGTPSNIFAEIDAGNIDSENAVVYALGTGSILYNQD